MIYSSTDKMSQFTSLDYLPRPIVGSQNSPPNLIFPTSHQHQWAQFSYPIQGHLEVWTQEAQFIALPQCAIWIPKEVKHKVEAFPNTIVRSLYINTDILDIPWKDCQMLTVDALLHHLIIEFSKYPINYDTQGAEGRLAQVLIDQIKYCKTVGLVLPWPNDPTLKKICRQIRKSPDNTHNLQRISQELNVSEKTLTRRFQKETGLGFRLWRQRARLIHALTLLEQNMRITDVAIACGYESLSSFTASFKYNTNMTPSEFVKLNKKRSG